MKRAGILGLAIVLTVAFGVGATQAAKKVKKFKTEATIELTHPDGYRFEGDVTSKRARCIRERTLELRYVPDSDSEEHVFETTTTDDAGHWQIDTAEKLVIGDYFVVVEKKKFRKRGKKRVCKVGVSPSVNPAEL